MESAETERKRVLFVDDEQAVLDGLRDSLRRYRKKWDMHFEQDPTKALAALEDQVFDVVVSDMRMPQMDGATLLQRVKERQPAAVRIILSGFTELEVALRAATVAHQFLTKPCDAAYLESVVERACQLQNLLTSVELRERVGKLESLPATPQIFAEVTKSMANPNATGAEIAKVIERDPAMSAKLLQLANSGFFRLARPIRSVEDAVVYLGYQMVKSLVLTTEVFSKNGGSKAKRATQQKLQQHSLLAALIAMGISPEKRTREDAFLAAILHDVGKLVLSSEEDDYPEKAIALSREEGCTILEAETKLYSVTHAEIGAYLLGLWGVSFNVVEAVAFHHRESDVSPESISRHPRPTELNTSRTLMLANLLAHEASDDAMSSYSADKKAISEHVEELASVLRVTDQLGGWRKLAADSVQMANNSAKRKRG